MTQEYNNVLEAKRSLKANINFMESLLDRLNGTDKAARAHAGFVAWCLHQYVNNKLAQDVQEALLKNMPQKGETNV